MKVSNFPAQASALAVGLLSLLGPSATAHAQGAAEPSAADSTVVITGSVRGQRVAEAPYAISVVGADELRAAGPQINLSEAMARVPGLMVANRSNFAQDLQISSRGFGARAGFGVRGVRLYTDGIPASMPDGQGQVSHFDLAGAQRVEVLRGPFSVLYGNSSGGVIAAFTGPVQRQEVQASMDVGSFGLRQARVGGQLLLGEGLDARVSVAKMQTDGFRPQSEAERASGHARLAWHGASDRVVLQLNALSQPAQDPLGLTRAQLDANPTQTTSVATQFNTRKTLRQDQLGVHWRHQFDADAPLRESAVTAYAGQRSVMQWLAINAATQANARHGGAVIDFDRAFQGLDARLVWQWGPVALTTGAASERMRDDRQGYLNYTGTQAAPNYGLLGALRRDEQNRAQTDDVYAQAELGLAPGVLASAGVRSGRVRLQASDRYLSNGDDSGSRQFSYVNPVAGLRWSLAPGLNVHASVARGYESPTLGELAYRADNTGGFNTSLEAQASRQYEAGAKWRSAQGDWSVDATLFRIQVTNEIGVASNAGGRQSFRNVGRTKREGIELASTWAVTSTLKVQAALTWLDATYSDGFTVCATIPCTTPTVPVAAGNRIAGTQKAMAFGELSWSPIRRTTFALEGRASSALMANDTNTDAAPRALIWALRAQHQVPLGQGLSVDLLARLDNATNKAYAGSVIVNDANGRYFEPGAPRSSLLSVRINQAF